MTTILFDVAYVDVDLKDNLNLYYKLIDWVCENRMTAHAISLEIFGGGYLRGCFEKETAKKIHQWLQENS